MPDPFDDEGAEVEAAPAKGGDQNKAFERITRERDEARQAREAAEARALAAERRIAFDDLKIDRKYAELYTGEVDPEKVKSWATQYGFLKAEDAPAPTPESGAPAAAPEAPAPAAPVQVGQPPVVGGKPTYEGKISVRDYQMMILEGRTDEAAKAYNEGRVEILTGGKFTGRNEE